MTTITLIKLKIRAPNFAQLFKESYRPKSKMDCFASLADGFG